MLRDKNFLELLKWALMYGENVLCKRISRVIGCRLQSTYSDIFEEWQLTELITSLPVIPSL